MPECQFPAAVPVPDQFPLHVKSSMMPLQVPFPDKELPERVIAPDQEVVPADPAEYTPVVLTVPVIGPESSPL